MFGRILICGVIAMGICANCSAKSNDAEYLSDLRELIYDHQQSWGVLGFDTATHISDKTPLPMRINDNTYTKGLGTHADSDISILLDRRYETFEAEIGLQYDPVGVGSVIFHVYVDGVEKYTSGVMHQSDSPQPISIPVKGAFYLRLRVTNAGDGITCDASNWANARLISDNNAIQYVNAANKDKIPSMDIAPFAKIVTFDPKRMTGALQNRLQEFKETDIFLEKDIPQKKDGTRLIPVYEGGLGCVGLLWAERRFPVSLSLEFSEIDGIPAENDVRLQYWSSEGRVDNVPHWGIVGQTEWQGKWEDLPGKLARNGKKYEFTIDKKVPELGTDGNGILKIRWIMPVDEKTPPVKSLSAISRYDVNVLPVRLSIEKDLIGKSKKIEMYNGYILKDGKRLVSCDWNKSGTLDLDLVYTRLPGTPDMTALRVISDNSMFTVAVDDIIKKGYVYVPDYGFLAALLPAEMDIDQYKEKIAGEKTILERVREMPDQTFENAQSKLLNPVNFNDPMLVSLACDNNKFFVLKNGRIQFESHPDDPRPAQNLSYSREIVPVFGTGSNTHLKRYIESPSFPMPITEVVDNNIKYTQKFFVAPASESASNNRYLDSKPLGVIEYTIENTSSSKAGASLALSLINNKINPDTSVFEQSALADFKLTEKGADSTIDGSLLLYMRKPDKTSLDMRIDDNKVVLSGKLSASEKVKYYVFIPRWKMLPEEEDSYSDSEALLAKTRDYWRKILSDGMRIDIPEPLMRDVFHANQMHILLAARNEDDCRLIAPWAASSVYGPLDTEAQAPLLAMDLLGYHDFARRCHEYFLSKYNDQGYLASGYTIMGTGQHLWTLGEHYKLTKDKEWIAKYDSQILKSCRWISDQRKKTMKLDADGNKLPEYGFMPPGVLADWERYAYYFYANGYYYAGMKAAASALADAGDEAASGIMHDADNYRKDILKGYRWQQERMPVLPLRNGTFMKPYPSSLYCFGLTKNFYEGASSIGHDVEVGGHHIVNHGIINPYSRDAELMTEYMEDEWFLMYHWLSAYDENTVYTDWFNYGGFSKLQPYYTRNADIYAARDDIKPYIRTCFNTFFPMLSTETLALWEHFNAQGGWNKTHETGWMLEQIRNMLIQERDKELWLAPFVTYNWLRDGMSVGVRKASTYFGRATYRIISHINDGYIEAVIVSPDRENPDAIVLRLRHPEGKKMKSVVVNGKNYTNFDSDNEIIRIAPSDGEIKVKANY